MARKECHPSRSRNQHFNFTDTINPDEILDEEGSSHIEIEQFSQYDVDTGNQKYQFNETFDYTDDILPFEFRHIRN